MQELLEAWPARANATCPSKRRGWVALLRVLPRAAPQTGPLIRDVAASLAAGSRERNARPHAAAANPPTRTGASVHMQRTQAGRPTVGGRDCEMALDDAADSRARGRGPWGAQVSCPARELFGEWPDGSSQLCGRQDVAQPENSRERGSPLVACVVQGRHG